MRYLSVCSGIEAATAAWHPLGWTPAAFSEIEPFPRAVLAHHYPDVPLHGDFTTIGADEYGPIDLLVGGTPCQSFSIAGLRGGLADDRGNLALEFLRLAQRTRAKWLVWENVPGVLSSNGGRDFGAILGGMAELGYGFAYRVLDAQFFGVPQRRRRVFVVGHLGDWRRAAAVLFERHSLSGHSAPRREKGKVAPTIPSRSTGGGGLGTDFDCDGGLIERVWPADIAPTLNAAFGSKMGLEDQHIRGGGACSSLPEVAMCLNAGAMGRRDAETETLIPTRGGGFDVTTLHGDDIARTLSARHDGSPCDDRGPNVIAFSAKDYGADAMDDCSPTLRAGGLTLTKQSPTGGGQPQCVYTSSAVRRLTPTECERLQGFPDDFTAIPWRGKPADQCPDGPRYKALGNSMAVPVMRWIGERIAQVKRIAA